MKRVLMGIFLVLGLFSFSQTAFSEEMASLYERLGGEAAIRAVVDDFVPRTAANPAVNFTRAGHEKPWDATPENVEHLKKLLVDFIGTATGGPQNYQGRDMKTAHQGMKIASAEFDAMAADLLASLKALNVPDKETNELMAIAASTKGAIVEVPAETQV